ncbi:hypothetical protein Q5P01_015910 [Channa striata]|uniref:Uncharacterized protein n=1 Tax=Channa striata TaxID=64152 RepID=A0AA88MGX2_CHASR|nr:hypothetical protein Q5P01_015910 [Channa striata]
MKGTREGEAGSFRFPLSISKIGLSLPRRCLFVSPRQGLTKERMQAARVEGQERAEGEKQREIEDGGGSEPPLGWDHLLWPPVLSLHSLSKGSLRKPQTSANSQPKVTKGTEGAGEQRRPERRGNLCFSSKSSAAHTDSLIITRWQQLCVQRWEN